MTSEQITMNVRARQLAEELIALAECECISGKFNVSRFWEQIAEQAASKINKVVVDYINVMSDVEASKFEEVEMPYGKYAHSTVQDIIENEPEYLVWLAENEFNKGLVAYMKSPYRKKQMQVLAQG